LACATRSLADSGVTDLQTQIKQRNNDKRGKNRKSTRKFNGFEPRVVHFFVCSAAQTDADGRARNVIVNDSVVERHPFLERALYVSTSFHLFVLIFHIEFVQLVLLIGCVLISNGRPLRNQPQSEANNQRPQQRRPHQQQHRNQPQQPGQQHRQPLNLPQPRQRNHPQHHNQFVEQRINQ
jgi:hypothetical protein